MIVKCLVIQMAWIPVWKNHATLGTIILLSPVRLPFCLLMWFVFGLSSSQAMNFLFRGVEWVLSLEKHHPIPNEEIWRLPFASKQISITFNIPWKKHSNCRQEDVVDRGIEIACLQAD